MIINIKQHDFSAGGRGGGCIITLLNWQMCHPGLVQYLRYLSLSFREIYLGAKSWPYGAHGYSNPSASNCNLKRCENASASVKLNYRPLPVGPQRGKDDRREYVRGGGLLGG